MMVLHLIVLVVLMRAPVNAAVFPRHSSSSSSTAPSTTTKGATTTYIRRELQEEKKQSIVQQYELWEAEEISSRIQKWASHYPDLLRVTTSQEAYGLPRAGGADDCPFDKGGDGCLNYILTLQDFVKHPEGSATSNQLPEVLWSGEVHGNERVGPTAVLEAAQLLMEAASCIAHPRVALRDNPSAWKLELTKARSCREEMKHRGLDESHIQWLARLVSTRRIVIIPTANALGYFRKVREEGNVDPNRDFPYDLTDPTLCMQSVAARTLNEVYREHLFQLALTFHGGMEAIGYEWGAPTWKSKKSPDDLAQQEIADAYSRYAGGWFGTRNYQYGPMNDLVYPVRGGMEDWAYAGSWDTDRVIACRPTTFGGYPEAKTVYDNSTLRVFNMLVETSNDKTPLKDQLGTSLDVLNSDTTGNGHVSRNIRLALLSADLVQPYVTLQRVNDLRLSDDVVSLSREDGHSCQGTRTVTISSERPTVTLEWTVGGALQTHETQVFYAKWSDLPLEKLDCVNTPNIQDVESLMIEGTMTSVTSGTNHFADAKATTFKSTIDVQNFHAHDKIVVIVMATADQNWHTQDPKDAVGPENSPPQSHIANARINADWYFAKENGKVVQGRREWFSQPLTIEIGEFATNGMGAHGSLVVETFELSNRLGETTGGGFPTGGVRPNAGVSPGTIQPRSLFRKVAAVGMLVFAAIAVAYGGRLYLRNKMRSSRRTQIRNYIQDESAPSPGLRDTARVNGASKSGYVRSAFRDDLDLEEEDPRREQRSEVELGQYT